MTTTDYIILSFIAGMAGLYVLLKILDKYRRKKIYYRAKAAEKKAIELLENHGYRILKKQPRKDIAYYLNGEKKQAYVKADFLASKYFRKVVCEVKTGENTRVTQALIRRQLLDYYVAYGVKEVVLIDMEKEKFDRIVFPSEKKHGIIFFLGIVAGLILSYIVYIYR